jgi:hypothetical protein
MKGRKLGEFNVGRIKVGKRDFPMVRRDAMLVTCTCYEMICAQYRAIIL